MPKGVAQSLQSAANSRPVKVLKAAGSFLFGPALLLAGAICGIFGKVAAETANALLSSWVKSVSSGVSTLFANNPLLTFASDASGKLMKGSWMSFAHFYEQGLTAIARGFEEAANHEGFGSTGIASSELNKNDPRDIEAMSGDAATAKRLRLDSKKFFEMLKDYNQTADETTTQEAIRELGEWAKKAKDLQTVTAGKTEGEIMTAVKEVEKGFEEAMEQNPALAALVDIVGETERLLMEAIQEKLDNNQTVTAKEMAEAFRGLAEISKKISDPNPSVKPKSSEVLGSKEPLFKAKL